MIRKFAAYWHYIAALITGFAVTAWILLSSDGMAGNDGYYHITIASMIWEGGITFDFPYLEFTLLDREHYVDMHMLYHILQAPFTALFAPEVAAKVASATFFGIAMVVLVWLLRQYDVAWPLFWALLLLVISEQFLYRMMMPRPPVFALIYSWLAFYCLMQRKYLALAAVAALFALTYKVFPILLPMAVVAMAVHYYCNRTFSLKPLLATAAGIMAGMVFTPYFPDNVSFLINAIRMKILADGYVSGVGNEWFPMKTLTLFKDAWLPLALYLLGLLFTDRHEWRRDPARLFWFLMATLWLLMLFKSRRFIEFFPPAALLFFIFAIRDQLIGLNWRQMRLPVAAVCAVALIAGWLTLSHSYQHMQGKPDVDAYAGGAGWLKAHTRAGTTVFQTDWDDFPRLFFHNRHNHYIVGLDPDYMRLKDGELYKLWRDIGRGKVAQPEDDIINRFGAHYVITDRRHRDFIRIADASVRMQRRFADRYTIVYRVLPKF